MRALFVAVLLASGCKKSATPEPAAASQEAPDTAATEDPAGAAAGVTNLQLKRLLIQHWDAMMERNPSWAQYLGDRRFDDKVFDPRPEAQKAFEAKLQGILLALTRVTGLDESDELTKRLLQQNIQNDLRGRVCQEENWAFGPRSNPLVWLNGHADKPRIDNDTDLANLLTRIKGTLANIPITLENYRTGLAEGLVGNKGSSEKVLEMVADQLAMPVEEWPVAKLIDEECAECSDEAKAAFGTELLELLKTEGVPTLKGFEAFVRTEILPAARDDAQPGLAHLPNGKECYEARIANHTTLVTTADVLHQRGLDNLETIHAEFRELGMKVFETDDLAEIFERLRTDEELYFSSSEEVVQTAKDALERAEVAVQPAFGRLHKAPCEVEPVPDYLAPYTTIAYYSGPAQDGSRPGTYYVNTLDPETRPRHEAEVLAFHEAVPGHHLQIAVAQELDEMPAFRRSGHFTAYIEGWALYTERLSDELGLYSDDLSRLGMLSFDAWRAARLAVDTGIHAKGWSRVEAERFMEKNTPLAKNNIANEVDRYINTPGQALGYKVGQLHILELRTRAKEELGEAFSLPEFHDVVLGSGAVPLEVMTDRVEAWIASKQ